MSRVQKVPEDKINANNPNTTRNGLHQSCSSNSSTAMNHNRGAQCVPLPDRGHVQHQLCLLLPHALEELKHRESTVRGAVVWPGGELEVADLPLLPSQGVRHLQVSHDEVLVVLNVLGQDVVHAVTNISSFQLWPVLSTLCPVSVNVLGRGPCMEIKAFLCL